MTLRARLVCQRLGRQARQPPWAAPVDSFLGDATPPAPMLRADSRFRGQSSVACLHQPPLRGTNAGRKWGLVKAKLRKEHFAKLHRRRPTSVCSPAGQLQDLAPFGSVPPPPFCIPPRLASDGFAADSPFPSR